MFHNGFHVYTSYMCSCGNETRKGQKNCNLCHAAFMRKWRKDNPLTAEQRKRMNCRTYLHVYVKRGKIIKGSCAVKGCNSGERIEGHHEDYDKPLEVIWLCRGHHLMVTSGFLRISDIVTA